MSARGEGMKKATGLFAAAVLLMASPVVAQSSKAAWRFEELIALSAATPGTLDTGWVNILTTHIKTPNAKELAIGVSLQCGLITDTTVKSLNGSTDSATAQARIAVRVRITDPNGDVFFAEPDNASDDLPGDIL